ncbi:MAG: hypothetical protein HRU33_05400 [Rhodobacteraceae bacterium]|nr:hypothetical protein [Paracoccaceae bacterium]
MLNGELSVGCPQGSLGAGSYNDLALTSLTGAALDSGSGLPVPTISVATDAGVSTTPTNWP